MAPRSVHPLPASLPLDRPASPSSASATHGSHTALSVLRLVREQFPRWRDSAVLRDLPDSAFHARPLTGGSSNFLWLLTVAAEHTGGADSAVLELEQEPNTPATLVVRFYGASTGAFVARNIETLVAGLLSRGGLGARIFHHFAAPHAGRIEQFIPGRTPTHAELFQAAIGHPVVRELARLHSIVVPTSGEYAIIPRGPRLFENLHKWMRLAILARVDLPVEQGELHPDDIYSLAYQHRLHASFGMPELGDDWPSARLEQLDFAKPDSMPPQIRDNRWYREVVWLQQLLDNWNDARPRDAEGVLLDQPSASHLKVVAGCATLAQIALCHNDANPGNILFNEDVQIAAAARAAADSSSAPDASTSPNPPRLPFTLIDFEYAGFNQPQFDLANHFCEYSLDYTVPSWPLFACMHREYMPSQTMMLETLKVYLEEKAASMSPAPAVTSAALHHMYVSTLTSMLASHFLWAQWSLIQSSTAPHSTETHPSWGLQADGSTFTPSALAYLEYAEQRLEMYTRVKQIWLRANRAADDDDDEFAPPPVWQRISDPAEWAAWVQRLEPVHDEIAAIQLRSHLQQQESFARYQRAAAAAASHQQQSN